MPEWLTIEVLDGEGPGVGVAPGALRRPRRGGRHERGPLYWEWHDTRWGVVLELVFADDDRLEDYRALPVVRAALMRRRPTPSTN